MRILTDEALSDFRIWIQNKSNIDFKAKDHSLALAELMHNSVLIHFFDQHGIIISENFERGTYNYKITFSKNGLKKSVVEYISRRTMQEYALLDCNEIYNSQFYKSTNNKN